LIESLGIKKTDTEKREREDCDEIGNMTRSGRCFKPDNLKTDKEKEKGKGKEKRMLFSRQSRGRNRM